MLDDIIVKKVSANQMSSEGSISENIKVFIRQRPLSPSDDQSEIGSRIARFEPDGSCTYFSSSSKQEHDFKFDACFGENISQEHIYATVAKPIVDSAIRGYSGTIFAYGPTGSGKTYTMTGLDNDNDRGIFPRCIEQILNQTHGVADISISYLQIYCEMVGDLLNPNCGTLSIRERSEGSIFVEGISKSKIACLEDLKTVLSTGEMNRSTASTLMNSSSSRSHAALIVTISFTGQTSSQTGANLSDARKRESSLILVDLAGSERSTASNGHYSRLEEAKAINLSLSALGNCMSALAEGRSHVPYRDSKLVTN